MDISLKLLIVFMVFMFFDPQHILTFLEPLRLALLSGILVFLSVTSKVFSNFFKNSQSWLLFLFYLITAISAFNSISWEISKEGLISLLKCIILYFVMVTILDSKATLEKFVWVLILFSGANIIITLVFAKLGIYKTAWRLTSYFGGEGAGANGYAMLLASLLPLHFFSLETQKSQKKKYFLILTILSFLLGIIRTRSRMGLGALILAILLILWDKRKKAGTILFLALLILVVITNTHQSSWERFDTISSELSDKDETDASVGGRMKLWKTAIFIMEDNLALGTGINTFVKAKQEKYFYQAAGDFIHVPHNGFLQIGAEQGIFALIVFVLIILLSIKNVWTIEIKLKGREEYLTIYNVAKSTRIGLVVFTVCLIFLSEHGSRILYTLIALSVSLKNIYQNKIDLEGLKKE